MEDDGTNLWIVEATSYSERNWLRSIPGERGLALAAGQIHLMKGGLTSLSASVYICGYIRSPNGSVHPPGVRLTLNTWIPLTHSETEMTFRRSVDGLYNRSMAS